MNCTNCGASLPEGTKFCTSCGAVLDETPAAATPEAPTAATPETPAAAAPNASALKKSAGLGNLIAAAISLMLGIFLVCHYLAAVFRVRGMGSYTMGWSIFNMTKCGKEIGAGGGFFAVFALIFGIIALLAILGAIFTLVTKNPMGWTLFKAALVLIIIVFIFTFIYGLFCSGSSGLKLVNGVGGEGGKISIGPSFGAWFSLGVSILSLIFLKKIKTL